MNEYHRVHVKTAYVQSEIRKGHHIEYDISLEQLLRKYYRGLLHEGVAPVYFTEASAMNNQYFVAMGENKEYYISLSVPPEFHQELQQLIDGETKPYHVYGRIEKLKFQVMHDDSVTEGLVYCTGIHDKEKIDHMISEKYQLKVMVHFKNIYAICTKNNKCIENFYKSLDFFGKIYYFIKSKAVT